MQKILVTGASGFLGQHVLRELTSRNLDCIAMSCQKKMVNSHGVTWMYQDFNEKITKENLTLLKGCFKVIHLAWSGLPKYNEILQITNNLLPQYHFLQKLLDSGIQDLTVTGTCLEYGQKEGAIEATEHPNPIIPYAIAKDTLRRLLTFLQKHYSYHLKWVRLFYMYGEGQSNHTLFGQLQNAILRQDAEFNMSPGDQLRDFLPVDSVAKYLVDVALKVNQSGIYNCASNNPISVTEFVEKRIAEKQVKLKLNLGYYPYADYEAHSFWGIPTSIKEN